MFASEPIDEKIIAAEAIPGWVDYVRRHADMIEVSSADAKTGKTAAGLYEGAAENIRQIVTHEVGESGHYGGFREYYSQEM